MILPTSMSYRKAAPSSRSLKVFLFRGAFLITLYSCRTSFGLCRDSYRSRRNLTWKPGKLINPRAEMRVRNTGAVNRLKTLGSFQRPRWLRQLLPVLPCCLKLPEALQMLTPVKSC